MTHPDLFDALSGSRPTNPELLDAAMRTNQQPAIAEALAAALAAKPPVGSSFRWWGLQDPPGGTSMIEDGRQLAIDEYPELYEVLGNRHNKAGDVAAGMFRIPDSRDRSGIGASDAHPVGETFGASTVALTGAQNGQHAHAATTANDSHDHGGTGNGGSHAHSGSTGGAGSHNHGGTDSAGGHTHGYSAHTGTVSLGAGSAVGIHQGSEVRNTGNDGSHNHSINTAPDHTHNIDTADAHAHSIPTNTHNHGVTVANSGSGTPHDNQSPVIACNHAIRVRS